MNWRKLFDDVELNAAQGVLDSGVIHDIKVNGDDTYSAIFDGSKESHEQLISFKDKCVSFSCCSYKSGKCRHIAALFLKLEQDGLLDKYQGYEFYVGNGFYGEIKNYLGDGTEVDIPEGITRIDDYVFADNSKLRTIKFSDSIINIGRESFRNCSNLEKFEIPQDCRIDKNAFKGCTKLADEDGFIIINGTLVDCLKLPKEFRIPENVVRFSTTAFAGNNYEEIEIPASVEYIGEDAFKNSKKLKRIEIPNTVKDIEFGAFDDSPMLEEVIIPKDMKSISIDSFVGCKNLTRLVFMGNNTMFYGSPRDKGLKKLRLIGSEEFKKNLDKGLKKIAIVEDLNLISQPASNSATSNNIVLYKSVDSMDVDQMMIDYIGSTSIVEPTLTKKKSVKAEINGTQFKVNYKAGEDLAGESIPRYMEFVELFEAEAKLMTHSETQDMVQKHDSVSDAFAHVSESVHPDASTVSASVVEKRYKFIFAMANMLADEAILKRIVEEAPKKKDGTLNKAKVYRIASTGLVERRSNSEVEKILTNEILEIYAKAKNDTILEIYGRRRTSGENEIQSVKTDFVSTHFDELGLGKYIV